MIDRTILSSKKDKRTDLDPPTDMETENQEDSDTSRSSFSSSASPVIPNQSFQLYQPPTAHLQPFLSLPPSSRPPPALSLPLISPTVPLPPPPLLATPSKHSMALAGLPSSSVSVATNFHTAPTTSLAASCVTEPTSQSSNSLIALRKAYKRSESSLVRVSSYLQFIEACSQQGKTPKGLTVNIRCSAYLADYSSVKAKFTETKGRAESEISESLRLHYRRAAQRLNSDVQEIEKAMQDITKVSNKRDRDEHHMYFFKTNDNIIKLEQELTKRKSKKINGLNTPNPTRERYMNNPRPNNRNRKIPIQRTILIVNLICRHPKVKSPRLLGCLASSSPPEKHHPPRCKPDLPLLRVSSPHRWLCPKLALVLGSPHCCQPWAQGLLFSDGETGITASSS